MHDIEMHEEGRMEGRGLALGGQGMKASGTSARKARGYAQGYVLELKGTTAR